MNEDKKETKKEQPKQQEKSNVVKVKRASGLHHGSTGAFVMVNYEGRGFKLFTKEIKDEYLVNRNLLK